MVYSGVIAILSLTKRAKISPNKNADFTDKLADLTYPFCRPLRLVLLLVHQSKKKSLWQTASKRIPLSKEWAYIKKFIDLQKIRTTNPDFLSLKMSGDTEGVIIAPMTLIPFAENAFKHATPRKTGNGVAIALHVENSVLSFDCQNDFEPQAAIKNETSGLGNRLIRRRLDLLCPNHYQMTVSHTENRYRVFLQVFRATVPS
jgi:LytS/YehU family sensor histidine kinase